MKYDQAIAKEMCDNLKIGMSRQDVCMLAGIKHEVFMQWLKTPEFLLAVKKAETEAKKRNIGLINKAAITHWQAAAWWLAHKYPKEFSKKAKMAFPDLEMQKFFESIDVLSESEIDNFLKDVIDDISKQTENGKNGKKKKNSKKA